MTVYVVRTMDTNFISSIEKIFLLQNHAEQYIKDNCKRDDLDYFLDEHMVLGDS